jgi:type II secretory pathway pseudopilin PulG
MRARTRRRPGYTLLEVLLASVVAVVLLGALYSALEVTLVRMDANRNVIVANDLSRAVFNRLTLDLSNALGPLPPKSGGDGTTGSAAASPTTTASTSSTTAATSASPSPDASGTASTADPATSAAASGVNIPFGSGVVGTDKQLSLFVSRLPTALTDLDVINATDVALPSDLRRVTYYLASDGAGLARQSKPWVTADGVWNATDPDRANELAEVIAPEVKDATFEYYDGGTWQSSWDGSQTDIDGVSLIGPPRAIRVVLVLEIAGRGGPKQKRVSQTIPLRAAVGNYLPADATTTTPTTSSSTTGGM